MEQKKCNHDDICIIFIFILNKLMDNLKKCNQNSE